MTPSRSAVVVGAGVNGLAIADALVRRQWDVRVVDQGVVGHHSGASDTPSRYIRWAHGPNRRYTEMVDASLRSWRDLELRSGRTLFDPVGVAWLIAAESPWLSASQALMGELGASGVVLDHDAATRALPGVVLVPGEVLFLETAAGLLRARRALGALRMELGRNGVQVELGRAMPDGGAVRLGEEVIAADVVVWAIGAWLPSMFPSEVDVRVTKQDVLYLEPPVEWADRGPLAWIDFDAGMYGAVGSADPRLKVASDEPGRSPDGIDADNLPARSDSDQLCRRYLSRRFPDLRFGPTAAIETCHYGLTADGEWLIAPHPEHPQVWLVGGDSGHGFKHGLVLGNLLAERLDGGAELPPSWALVPRAEAGLGLRTAGRNV